MRFPALNVYKKETLLPVKMNRPFLFLVIILTLWGLIGRSTPARAQEYPSEDVGEIIQGFEGDVPEDDTYQDLIQGFEDDAADDSKTPLAEDDLLQGFEDEPDEPAIPKAKVSDQESSWRLDGELVFTSVYNISENAKDPWKGFTMLRPEMELTLKNRFSDKWQGQIGARGFYDLIYGLRGRDKYTAEVLDDYESELELKDTFIQGSLSERMDVKLGRQIVVWGTLDNLRVNDVLNPLDLRLPGLIDIDDLRLPVTMGKLDYYFGNWNLAAMAIPEVRFSKRPVFGSDFYPFKTPAPPEEIPDDGLDNLQYGAALTGVFSGWDLGFYGARIYADQPYGEVVYSGSPGQMVQKHARIMMLGSAANLALGNWLLKAEAAWLDGLRYTLAPGVEYDRFDLGLGVEYSGFSETTISVEAANRHILDFDAQLEQPPEYNRENQFQWRFRITRDFINDTLTLNLLAGSFGEKVQDGTFERLDARYDITDAVSIRGGVILYQIGDTGRYQNIDNTDRLFLEFKYSF